MYSRIRCWRPLWVVIALWAAMGSARPAQQELQKIMVQNADVQDLIRTLLNSSSPKGRDGIRSARSLDELDIIPGTYDPVTGAWYYPNQAPPIFGGAAVQGVPQYGGFA